jgi:hypothetical protein
MAVGSSMHKAAYVEHRLPVNKAALCQLFCHSEFCPADVVQRYLSENRQQLIKAQNTVLSPVVNVCWQRFPTAGLFSIYPQSLCESSWFTVACSPIVCHQRLCAIVCCYRRSIWANHMPSLLVKRLCGLGMYCFCCSTQSAASSLAHTCLSETCK